MAQDLPRVGSEKNQILIRTKQFQAGRCNVEAMGTVIVLLFAKPLLTQRERTGKHTKDNTMSIGVTKLVSAICAPQKFPRPRSVSVSPPNYARVLTLHA